MRALVLLPLFLFAALALPQLDTTFSLGHNGAEALATVTGESPLEINIPDGASVQGANYSDGTAVFNQSFSYRFDAAGMLADSNGEKLFLFVMDQPTSFNYTVAIAAPEGVPIDSAAPEPAYVTDGRRVAARWAGVGGEGQFSMRFHEPGGPVVHFVETDIPIVDKTIFLPGLILAFLFGYFLAAGTVAALFQRIKLITAGMSPDEKGIVYLLRDGPLPQSAIQKKLDFSKAKLSRTIRGMEERGIVRKTPKGKTNLISLK